MKKGQGIKKRRIFSKSFKQHLVKEYESGKFTVLELCKLHGVNNPSLYSWIYKYSTYNQSNTVVVEMKESSLQKLKAYEKRIKDLEQIVGQKQIQIDYLEKIIDLSNQHFDTDLKKNSNTQP
ncbi:MAG: transposase [Saprospiraceae bacterium]